MSSRSSLREKLLPRAGRGGSSLPEVSTRCTQFARLPTAKFFSVRTRISPSLSAPPVQARASERRNHHACAVAGDLPGGKCARKRAGKRREMRAHTPVVFSQRTQKYIFFGLHPFSFVEMLNHNLQQVAVASTDSTLANLTLSPGTCGWNPKIPFNILHAATHATDVLWPACTIAPQLQENCRSARTNVCCVSQ